MPTTKAALTLAESALFAALVDDAAVFPPGNLPVADAVPAHRTLRTGAWRHHVGPLVIGPDHLGAAVAIAESLTPSGQTLEVVLAARPGVSTRTVRAAAEQAQRSSALQLVGIDLGWTPDWSSLRDLGARLSIEVPRGDQQKTAIADIATTVRGDDWGQAKYRTGATPQWEWPDETDLATFIRTAIDHDLGFKMTGGLHHAARGTDDDGSPHHGVLNVLSAVRHGLNGEEVDELATRLSTRDVVALADDILRMSAADASIVRAFFTSFGCCAALEPIGEIAHLGLVQPTP